MYNNYISRQITVYKNDRALLEFTDKLKPASLQSYAHIHADGEQDVSGYRRTSLIGILLKDYSKGTGDKAITVTANVSPEEIRFILTRITCGFSEYSFSADKIFGAPDAQGRSLVTKLQIWRHPLDQKGAPTKKPWHISLENGSAVPKQNQNGGTYMAANSYQRKSSVFISLSDEDLFKQLSRVATYIDAWEKAVGPGLITNAYQEMERQANQNP